MKIEKKIKYLDSILKFKFNSDCTNYFSMY